MTKFNITAILKNSKEGEPYRSRGKEKFTTPNAKRTDLSRYMQARYESGAPTIKRFVEMHRDHDSDECVFVPGALKDRPARVDFCGKSIAAARYMALLTHGTPEDQTDVVRHLCGNGHLSCINPNHVVWGSHGDNQGDANRHRNKRTVEEKLAAAREGYRD